MRIHSDHLTTDDLYAAAENLHGVYVDVRHTFRSRSRRNGWDVTLYAEPGRDREGTKRRPKNSGTYGAGMDKAATYREHGWWMLELFAKDPDAAIGIYNGVEDFHRQTRGQFDPTVRTILRYDRLRSSVNGNPRYRVTFEDGSAHNGMSDAGWAYAMGNPEMREGSRVRVDLTRAGNIRSMRAA